MQVFVGNVSHGTRAPDLVKHLHHVLASRSATTAAGSEADSDSAAPVLRCEVKRNSRATFAFVTLRSQDTASALLDSDPGMFAGRPLRLKLSKGSFRKPMGVSKGFKCDGFQLCTEWPVKRLTCWWEVTSGVTFQARRMDEHCSVGQSAVFVFLRIRVRV